MTSVLMSVDHPLFMEIWKEYAILNIRFQKYLLLRKIIKEIKASIQATLPINLNSLQAFKQRLAIVLWWILLIL